MKITKILLATSLTLGFSIGQAQPSRFQGAFGQVGVGYESVSPTHDSSTLSVNGRAIPVTTSSNNANSMIGTFTLGYYHDVAKGFLLGVGAEYSPFAGSGSNMTVSTTNALPGQNNITNDYRYQKKDSYNLFLSPAMMVGKEGMAYAKIGYTGAKVNNYNTLGYNFSGYSLGLGYKQFFSGNWYGFVEANYADYGSQTESATNPISPGRTLTASGTNSLTTYNGVVGIGYKF
jgi:hypothetical protein